MISSSRCIASFASRPYLLGKTMAYRIPGMSVARITTAEMKELHKDYKPDRIDKYILMRFGKYPTYEAIPRRVPHDEMEAAKSKFRVESYFFVTVAIMVTAAWVAYLSRSEQHKHNDILADMIKGTDIPPQIRK